MKLYAPDYYMDFKCIADKCNHNCCIGWEIDIDCNTYEYYSGLQEKIGIEIRNNIIKSEDSFCFKLAENERCPFLDEKNLCRVISELGEDGLCNICYDHPRFRNFFGTRQEIGLGICCEEACRIILTKNAPFKIVQIGYVQEEYYPSEEESRFFKLRDDIFKNLYGIDTSLDDAILKILQLCKIENMKNFKQDCIELYKSLERLDSSWDEKLEILNLPGKEYTYEFDRCFKNLFAYFVFRHTADSVYDGNLKERICFCVMSVNIIRRIFMRDSIRNLENLLEIVRMYSAEIEYSQGNTQKLIEYFY